MHRKTAPKTKRGDVIDHIDPKNSYLICGLDITINKIVLDQTTNNCKSNRFVPYMVDPDIAIHREFGDWGIFLIQDKWCWCEFGGPEWWAESKRLGYSSTKAGEKTAELGVGIHGRSAEQMSAHGKKNGKKAVELKLGIHGRSAEKMTADGKISGILGGLRAFKLGVGVHGRSAAQMTADGKKGGPRAGAVTSAQKWQCLVTEYVSTPCGLSHWQRKRGIDTSLRVRRLDLEGKI